ALARADGRTPLSGASRAPSGEELGRLITARGDVPHQLQSAVAGDFAILDHAGQCNRQRFNPATTPLSSTRALRLLRCDDRVVPVHPAPLPGQGVSAGRHPGTVRVWID